MSIEFENPLTAGTVLVREQIQSQNYDPGVAGWVVKANGDAEFNDVVIRGGTVVSGVALYYDGTPAAGNLVMSIAAAAGTDAYGNDYARGVTVYNTTTGSQVQVDAGAGASVVNYTPPAVSGVTWETGTVAVATGSRLGTDTPYLYLGSPYNQASPSGASITLYGSPASGAGAVTNEVFISTQRVWVTGDATVNGQLIAPKSIQWRTESVSSVGAVTSFTTAITFDNAYPSGVTPSVVPNIATGSGTFARWQARAINITNTGFDLFLQRGDNTDPAVTWTNQPVCWTAYGHD